MHKLRSLLFKVYQIILFTIGYFGYIFKAKFPKLYLIVGSGRCGSSLLTKILKTSRELLVYPGEANDLWHPKLYNKRPLETPQIIEDPEIFTQKTIKEWKQKDSLKIKCVFLGYSLLHGKGKPLVVKSAMISHMIPFIKDLFLDIHIIHLYRNGISVTSSLLRKEHRRYQQYNSNEFEILCAKYWNDCILTIDKKLQILNTLFLELSYEELVENPNESIKKISLFLNICKSSVTYDISLIRNENYKIGNYQDKKWDHLQSYINKGMKLKGYY